MSVRTRFSLWIFCVLGLLLTPPIGCALSRFDDATASLRWAVLLAQIACYAGLVALLMTTPPDAIKLPPQRSVRLITAGTAGLYFVCWTILEGLGHGAAIAVLAGGVAWLATSRLAAAGVSAWLAVIVFWMPGFVGPVATWAGAAVCFACFGIATGAYWIYRPN